MRQYFYKKKGKLKPYYYCSHCPAGPFTEDDLTLKIHKVGQQQSMYFCDECYKMLFSSVRESADSYRPVEWVEKPPIENGNDTDQ